MQIDVTNFLWKIYDCILREMENSICSYRGILSPSHSHHRVSVCLE